MTNLFETVKGDLLEATGIIIHGCNNVGVMGSGVARGIKARFPAAYEVYAQAHQQKALHLGSVIMWRVSYNKWIANAITQTLGGPHPLDLNALQISFESVLSFATETEIGEKRQIGSIPICFPLIGAGRGGGDWNRISVILNDCLYYHSVKRKATLYVVDAEPSDCT